MTDRFHPSAAASATSERTLQGQCRTRDDLRLNWRAWVPASPLGVIVVVHGLAEHGGRYRQTAEAFAERGWAVYAGDLRGHGLSEDVPRAGRVHVDRFTDYFHDVDALTSLAQTNHPDIPLFLLGHSMGGLISISYVLQGDERLAGAVISSPALGTHPDFSPPPLLRLLVSLLDRVAPRMRFPSDLDTAAISRDPLVVQDYVDDPLVSDKVSARWYAEILRAMERAHRNAGTLSIPLLLMQSGDDRLVDPAAAARWASGAPQGLVELVSWDGLFHEMFNEPEKDRIRSRTLDWLQQRLPRPGPREGLPGVTGP